MNEQLALLPSPSCGVLVGFAQDPTFVVTVYRFSKEIKSKNDLDQELEQLRNILAGGYDVIGVFGKGTDPSSLARYFQKDSFVVVRASEDGNDFEQLQGPKLQGQAADPSRIIVRVRTELKIENNNPNCIEQILDRIDGENLYLCAASKGEQRVDMGLLHCNSEGTLGMLVREKERQTPSKPGKTPMKQKSSETAVIEMSPYWNAPKGNTASASSSVPILSFVPATTKNRATLVSLDVLFVGKRNAEIRGMVSGIAQQLRNQLQLLMQSEDNKPYHFQVGTALFTIVFPVKDSATATELDESLLSHRRVLHEQLGLPMYPVFRLSQAFQFKHSNSIRDNDRLSNVHQGLTAASEIDGSLHLVQGDYLYYHYMQDNFNDDGWGCAYRSLQTIVSWFRCQHYTSVPVPSHKDIQTILVKNEEKTPSFIGSKQWIGAIEISTVLGALLSVECVIMTLPTGPDIASRGRELARHFKEQGTPVMIGGGVLAYTLLGIDWNQQTGDMRLLILDPHYKGVDTLTAVQAKKWVAWHPVTLLRADSFYNLCMPQRPKTV